MHAPWRCEVLRNAVVAATGVCAGVLLCLGFRRYARGSPSSGATRVGGDERRDRNTVTGVYVNVGKAMAAFERSRLPRRRAPVRDVLCAGWRARADRAEGSGPGDAA